MQNKIYQQMWIELPKDMREHLIRVFGIVKTGGAEVRDGMVISDGVTSTDLGIISDIKMEEYVGSKETFHRLWELTISKARYELHLPILLENVTGEMNKDTPTTALTVYKFCDFCDSKGVKHKATCTKPGIVNGFKIKSNEQNKETSKKVS